MKYQKIILCFIASALLITLLCACNNSGEESEVLIKMSDEGITVNDKKIGNDIKSAVYVSNDIIYYEDRTTYESGNNYGEGESDERHSKDKAMAHTVVNITEPGTYRLSGKLSLGQIRVDLGEEAKTNPQAVVNLILDSVDINCEVAPAILFLNVYECDNNWSVETASYNVDTSSSGANIILADNSINTVNGSHVAKIYKDTPDEKKLWKQDGAVYSYMSMNVLGNSGILEIYADNEGLDTELHLTINGGNINIRSGNDGINTNEDGVSVTTINGGDIRIIAGLGAEGDGIDSNGWLVINGGTLIASANPKADAGLDSDMGSFVNGGIVVALGSTMDWAESDSKQVTMNLQFAEYKASDDAIIITREDGSVVFAYDPSEDEIVGLDARKYMGAVISAPEFAVGDVYNLYIGGEISGSEINGIYVPSSIVSYDGAVMQAYGGTDVMRGPGFGGMKPGREFNDEFIPKDFEGTPEFSDMPEGEMPEFPEFGQGEFTDFGTDRKPDFPNGERPDKREDFTGGKGNKRPSEIPAKERDETILAYTEFYMQDKVNNFSKITDYNAAASTL